MKDPGPSPAGTANDVAPSTFGSLPCEPALRALLEEFIASRKAANTRDAYRIALGSFLRGAGISTVEELLAIRAADIVDYRNGLQKRKRAPSTANQHLAAVRGLYRRLLRQKKIEANPADPELVEGFSVSRESHSEALSLDEVKRILATCDGTLRGLRDRALILTLYYEGLRRSEASKLNWRDLTTRRGLLEVRDAKNSPYATIKLRPEAREAVDAYTEVLNRELRRRAPGPNDPVFVSLSPIRSFARRLAPNSVNKIVKRRVEMAGIERRVTAHGLRHTCATHALQKGVQLDKVQRHLRHADPRTTMRYNHDRDARTNPTTEALPSISIE